MADSTLDGWGSALAPASTTLIAARTAAGTSGRATVRQIVDASAVLGHMYYYSLGSPAALAGSAGFTSFTAGELVGMTYVNDATADYLRVDTAGRYLVQWTADIDFPTSTTFSMGLYVNGVLCSRGCTFTKSITAPAAAGTDFVGGHTVVPLVALDQLSWRWVRTGAGTASMTTLSLSAHRWGA
jgi:hypothetical protein